MPKARLVFNGDWVYIEKEKRIYQFTQEIANKVNNIPGVIDNTNSTSTTDALSANMGKYLQDQINNLSWMRHFISAWDCTTGLPLTEPAQDPYTYSAGDFFIVSAVDGGGWTNYRPHWATYTHWVPSTAVETETVGVTDIYIYDWSTWILLPSSNVQIIVDDALSNTSTHPVQNRVITWALNQKQDVINDLSIIRAWAALWATSLQSWDNITELVNNAGYQDAWDVIAAITWYIYRWAVQPQNPAEGMLWYDTVTDKLKIYNWTQWIEVWSWGWGGSYTAGNWININWQNVISNTLPGPIVSSTAPTNPTEWMLWYDTTNDILMSYDGTNWNWAGAGIKFFDFDGTAPKAEEIMMYIHDNPDQMVIVRYQNGLYFFAGTDGALEPDNGYYVYFWKEALDGWDYTSYTSLYQNGLTFYGWNWAYSSWRSNSVWWQFLSTNVNYRTPYMPQYPGQPTSKKYVDDRVNSVFENIEAWDNINIETTCVISNDKRWPCPEWFHVPDIGEVQNLFNALGRNSLDISALKMPLSWARDSVDGSVYDQGSYWYYATNYAQSGWRTRVIMSAPWVPYYSYMYMNRANWFPVRPFKDEFASPDNTWTTLEDFSQSYGAWAWIFWNEDDGLISLVLEPGYAASSYNITIADKNLWATVVYNDWDTLSQANCWNYYQRWNNHWFPYTWSVTTSSTQVDTTGYWPGNYYDDDTFIIWYTDWSNPQNNNLWGYTSWQINTNCSMVISADVPESAAWWNITGDISNQTDLAYALLWKADVADVNTKTFYLSSTSDITTAQAAYNWWNAGKYAIIVYQSESYVYEYDSSTQLKFKKIGVTTRQDSSSVTQFKQDFLYFTLSSWTVTEISAGSYASIAKVLSTDVNYSSPYTPQYDGSPATKKYVDDSVNTKTFYLADNQDLTTAQAAYDWYDANKNPIILYNWDIYFVERDTWSILYFRRLRNGEVKQPSYTESTEVVLGLSYSWWTVTSISSSSMTINDTQYLRTDEDYSTPYTPVYNGSPATKKYVDDSIVRYTAWSNITIDANNVISTTLGNVFIFRWSVSSYSNLPASWQSVWDVWIALDTWIAWAWDWTQWISLWGMSNLSNYFNKTQDDSDDITQWTTNLFVTQQEKNTWNAKQNALTAWANIQINWNTISATNTTYSGWTWISISWTVISNTWVTSVGWQSWSVSLKTVNGNSLIGSWDVVIAAFAPATAWTAWQVLTKTANWYNWMSNSSNIKCFQLNMIGYTQAQLQEIVSWINTWVDYGAVVKTMNWAEVGDVFLYSNFQSGNDWLEYLFVWTKSYTETYPDNNNSQFTKLGNWLLKIIYNPVSQVYSLTWTRFNDVANFIECTWVRGWQWYHTPFMPTQWWQPATKAYVDSVAWWGWAWAITNETTWTTYAVSKIWSWTQAQYNNLSTKNPNTLYFVF